MQKQEAERQFEKHIAEHRALIYKVARVYTYSEAEKEDLFQEIVIQLWRAYPKFKGQSKFSTWLYRVALNTAITGLRRQKHFMVSYEPASLPQQIDATPEFEKEDQLNRLYEAIGQLNEVEKAIVMLYMEDKGYEEMEDILGISQGSLRVKMSRIKEKLRQLTK